MVSPKQKDSGTETSGQRAVMECHALLHTECIHRKNSLPRGQTLRKEVLNEKPGLVLKFFLNQINKKAEFYKEKKNNHGLRFLKKLRLSIQYGSPPLFTVSLCVVSGTCSQTRSKNMGWKIPEIENS